jgi:hypothetical protein
MVLCPVDLAPCTRPGCRGGSCQRVNAATLAVCWECGAVEAQGVIAGICIACVASATPLPRNSEE